MDKVKKSRWNAFKDRLVDIKDAVANKFKNEEVVNDIVATKITDRHDRDVKRRDAIITKKEESKKIHDEKMKKGGFYKLRHNAVSYVVGIFTEDIPDLIKSIWQVWPAVLILVLATLGLSALIAELPFLIIVPAIIEAEYVIPVISTLIVSFLLWIMDKTRVKSNEANEQIVCGG